MSHNQYPIPKRYLEPSAVAAAERLDPRLSRWASDWNGASGGLLVGKTGTGKTLAAARAAERIRRGNTDTWVRWIRADELSRILNDRNGADQVHELKQSRVLVIDELGYERFPELVLEVIGARHDHDRPTLVTSGLTVEAIAQRYSDATVRRITEVGNGCVVDLWARSKPIAVGK